MKRFMSLVLVLLAAIALKAQNPVSWNFSAKKIGDKTFEVRMSATLQTGWHLYSQTQPDDAVAMPTVFTINKNPLLSLEGKIKEEGKMEKFHDAKLDLSAHQYSKKVDFVQIVKLKANAKTNLTGNVEFQTCDDEKCLPPKKTSFSITLN